MTNLLTIGRFSQITRLTPKALRLYDEQALLRPVLVDDRSGYRYYSLSQVGEARYIQRLKAAGMTLEQIQALLRAQGSEARQELLEAHALRLNEQEAELRKAREALATLEREAAAPYPVDLKTLEPQPCLSLRRTCAPEEVCAAIAEAQAGLLGFLRGQLAEASGPSVVVYHESDLEAHYDAWDIEVCQPYRADFALRPEAPLQTGTLPGGAVAYTVHAGPYNGAEGLEGAYASLWAWITGRGLEAAGPTREVYLFDPFNTERPEDYRTEVAWPVRPMPPA